MNTFTDTSQIPGIAVYAIDISNKYRTLLIGCILVGPSGSVILYKRRQNLPQLQLSHGSLLRFLILRFDIANQEDQLCEVSCFVNREN